MSGWIDVSVAVAPGETPTWPGSPPIRLERRLSLERGDPANDSTLRMSVHTGTHVDAPSHVVRDGATVDSLPLDAMMGRCRVLDLRGRAAVGRDELQDAVAQLPDGEPPGRLLLRTDNSDRWSAEFRRDFVGMTPEAARWIAEADVRLLGIDYLSVQRYEGSDAVHGSLLGAGTVLVEGLCLAGVEAGPYQLACLPVKLRGAEAAPARVCLRPIASGDPEGTR